MLGDTEQAVEASQHIALLADDEKELSTWTDIATGVYATFGASLPVEGLAEAANETANTGTVTGSLADALNWAGISEDDFNAKLEKCTSEQQRQDLIMNTLNKTYSKASEQYKATNKDVMEARKAQERLTNAFADVGAVCEPIITAIKNKIADMAAVAVPKVEALIQKVKDMKKWIKDNKNTVDAWKAGIIAATVSIGSFLLVLKWGSIMSAATKAIKLTRAAVLLFNAALRANPIGFVISLLAGLVAGFVYLWKNNEGFRKFWIDMWKKIKSACGDAVKWIKDKLQGFKDAVKTVRNAFDDIKNAIGDKMDAARDKVSGIIKKIKGYFPFKIGKIFSDMKIPKISVSGGKAPFGIAGKGKLPSFNVKWNAEGAILTRPTIFGQVGDTYLGGGEAGAEAVAPIGLLQGYVAAAVRSETGMLGRILMEQTALLMDFLRRNMPNGVRLDTGALVGELVPAMDAGLADRWNHARRGNTR